MSMFTRTALAAALLAVAPLASAATDSSDMTVSIQIQNACTITAEPLDFGAQTSVDTAIDDATTVELDCSAIDSAVMITFGNGAGAGATYDSRKMTNADGDTINYSLFVDTARSQALGDGAGNGVALVTDSDGNSGSTGTVQTFDVYGRVFGGQGPKPVGAYTDTVVATVTF
jgi:spore coat protein U-like protein